MPLDWRGVERFSARLTGRPVISGKTKKFVYTSRLTDLPLSAVPDVLNRSFRMTAHVEIDKSDGGMILTQGGIEGAFAFMVKNQELVFAYNFLDLSSEAYTIIESSETQDIGSDHGTSIAPGYYKAPFEFSGKLDQVVRELK